MALAMLALRNLQQRVSSSFTSLASLHNLGERRGVRIRGRSEFLKRFIATSASDEKKESKEVAVGEKKSKLFPRKRGRRSLWRNNEIPTLHQFFPSGLRSALLQATENINRRFENMIISPLQLMGRVKMENDCYRLRYEVPGLTKDDTVEDGVLTIKGEHKEEVEDDNDDDFWSSRSYGNYNTSLVLPDDAKADDIKAELKDGVLNIIIPRTEKPKKDVKEVKIN